MVSFIFKYKCICLFTNVRFKIVHPIPGLEAMDEKAEALEPSDSFSHTKQTIAMVLADLTKIRKLSNINMIEALEEIRATADEGVVVAGGGGNLSVSTTAATAANISTGGDIKF